MKSGGMTIFHVFKNSNARMTKQTKKKKKRRMLNVQGRVGVWGGHNVLDGDMLVW